MAFEVRSQQISGLPIVKPCAFALAIGRGRNDQQTQGASSGASLPVDLRDNLITNTTSFAAIKDLGGVPRDGVVLTHTFGGELLGVVETTRSSRSGKTQNGILAGTGDDFGFIDRRAKHSAVTETAVDGHDHDLERGAGRIQDETQILYHGHELLGKIVFPYGSAIPLPFFRRRPCVRGV